MSATLYLERDYGADVSVMRSAGGNRISLVSLMEERVRGGGPIAEHARVFHSLENKTWFLWCLFFDVLLDQAIHSAERSVRLGLPRPQSLKLAGILASYHMNLHPALLLLTASLLCGRDEEAAAVADFKNLTNAEMRRYGLALGGADGKPRPESTRVYAEMSNGMALLFLPRGFASFSKRDPNLGVYDLWTSAVAEALVARGERRDQPDRV